MPTRAWRCARILFDDDLVRLVPAGGDVLDDDRVGAAVGPTPDPILILGQHAQVRNVIAIDGACGVGQVHASDRLHTRLAVDSEADGAEADAGGASCRDLGTLVGKPAAGAVGEALDAGGVGAAEIGQSHIEPAVGPENHLCRGTVAGGANVGYLQIRLQDHRSRRQARLQLFNAE